MSRVDGTIIFYHQSLSNWIDNVHTSACNKCEMPVFEIYDFGYDSYASILNAILPNITMLDIMSSIQNKIDYTKFMNMAHSAWSAMYVYWKNCIPDELSDDPQKNINTYDRNDRATTNTNNLNDDDIGQYKMIIDIVFEILTKKVLEAGMQNLDIR